MSIKYNKAKHFELLKYSQDLDNQGKSLRNENKEKYLELLEYSAMMVTHLYWETRNQYLQLMKEFMDGKITGSTFRLQYLERNRSIEKAADMLEVDLILLEPNEKATEFDELIEQIFTFCELYRGDLET